jgi:hypothetical protein
VGKGEAPVWLDQNVAKASLMDTETAQTTPLELTTGFPLCAHRIRICVKPKHRPGGILTWLGRGGRRGVAMMDAAVAKGAQVKIGKVEGMKLEGDTVVGVIVDGAVVKADCVVIAMGPWCATALAPGGGGGRALRGGSGRSCMAEDWFPGFSVPMEGVRSTSIVFKTDEAVDPYALFCAEDMNGSLPCLRLAARRPVCNVVAQRVGQVPS